MVHVAVAMTTTMRKTTKRTMKSTMQSVFRDRMSVYSAVGLGWADFQAHFYGELRNVAEQKVPKLKRPVQWLVFAAHYVRQAKERHPRAKERGWSSLRIIMCGKLRSVAGELSDYASGDFLNWF